LPRHPSPQNTPEGSRLHAPGVRGPAPARQLWSKGIFSLLFYFLAEERGVWLCPPPRCSCPSPGAGGQTSAPAIFTHRDHERASDLPRGTLPCRGGTAAGVGTRAPVRLRNGGVWAAAGEEGVGGAARGSIENGAHGKEPPVRLPRRVRG